MPDRCDSVWYRFVNYITREVPAGNNVRRLTISNDCYVLDTMGISNNIELSFLQIMLVTCGLIELAQSGERILFLIFSKWSGSLWPGRVLCKNDLASWYWYNSNLEWPLLCSHMDASSKLQLYASHVTSPKLLLWVTSASDKVSESRSVGPFMQVDSVCCISPHLFRFHLPSFVYLDCLALCDHILGNSLFFRTDRYFFFRLAREVNTLMFTMIFFFLN